MGNNSDSDKNKKWQLIGEGEKVIPFDPTLFLCQDTLSSCSFVIYPPAAGADTSERSLATIIEKCGGTVLKEPDDNSIPIVDIYYMKSHNLFLPEIPDWQYDLFSGIFIYVCIHEERITDLNQYRFLPESLYEDYDANEILMKTRKWSDLTKKMANGRAAEETQDDENENMYETTQPKKIRRKSPVVKLKVNNNTGRKTKNVLFGRIHAADGDTTTEAETDINMNDNEESVVTDTPIIDVEQIKNVHVNKKGLPVLPSFQQSHHRVPDKDKNGRSGRLKLHDVYATAAQIVKKRRHPDPEVEAEKKKKKTVSSAEKSFAKLSVSREFSFTPTKKTRLVNGNSTTTDEDGEQPCSSKQAKERRETSTRPPKLTLPSPAISDFSSDDSRSPPRWKSCAASVSSPSSTKQKVLPRTVSPIDDRPPRVKGRTGTRQDNRMERKAHRTPFSRDEDRIILTTIMENNWYANYAGNEIYKWMEENPELNLGRTYHSLRDRFIKRILPYLRLFHLTEKQLRAFKDGEREIKKGRRRPPILPPLPKRKK